MHQIFVQIISLLTFVPGRVKLWLGKCWHVKNSVKYSLTLAVVEGSFGQVAIGQRRIVLLYFGALVVASGYG